jgi:hypothetical protein
MQMLSDDDVDIAGMTPDQLDAAWDLWFDLAQATNEADPSHTHGVFAGADGTAAVTSVRSHIDHPGVTASPGDAPTAHPNHRRSG